MIRLLQTLNDLYSNQQISITKIIWFLNNQLNKDKTLSKYEYNFCRELIAKLLEINSDNPPKNYIKYQCLGQLTNMILEAFDISMLAAYILAIVIVERTTTPNFIYAEVLRTNLLDDYLLTNPGSDREVIIQSTISALEKAELLWRFNPREVAPGLKLKLHTHS